MDENNETKDGTRQMVVILAKNNHKKQKQPQKIQQTKIMKKKLVGLWDTRNQVVGD
jgi:hypothetical protein